MKYWALRILFGWLARLGLWLHGKINDAETEWMIRNSLRPGTPVFLRCACHDGVRWFVEKYHCDADDYSLVSRWPAPNGHSLSTIDKEWMYIKRDKFGVAR